MEQFSITKTTEGFHIDGFPNAVKVLRLSGPKAKQLAELVLHRGDLEFALTCLESINEAPSHPSPMRQALQRSAIVHFLKCFGDDRSRFSLRARKVYKGDKEGLEIYKHFESLRNKHIIHDENSYAQCLPGAILNKENLDNKIAKIICFNAVADTLDKASYSNLHLLCTRARAWVEKQFVELCVHLTSELDKESYDALYRREGMTYTLPGVEHLDVRRNTP